VFLTVVDLFLFILQHNGMPKAKTAIASQAKDFYTYKNTKIKLLSLIEDIFFNQRCFQKRSHPKLCKYKNPKRYGSSKMYQNIRTKRSSEARIGDKIN